MHLPCAAVQVMELDNRLQKAGADAVKKDDDHRKVLAAMQSQLAAAATGAAGAAAATAQADQAPLANGMPPAGAIAAAADGSVLNNMRKQAAGLMQNISNQAPGYARMLQDTLMGNPQATAAMGGPEHVPQPVAARSSMPGIQETELERKTRELQVGTGCLCLRCLVAPYLSTPSN